MQKITPFLWFDNNAEEAIDFYLTVFKHAKKGNSQRYPAGSPGSMDGKYMTGTFSLEGQEFIALNGGPVFKQTEAFSLVIDCKDQEEVDYYWNKLTADGGQESQCGWLKDKFGLSWQVTPSILPELMNSKDPAQNGRVMQAMLKMSKIIIKDIEEAAKGQASA